MDSQPVDAAYASGADNEPTTARHDMTERATASREAPNAGPSVEAPASAHQGGPLLSDTGASLPVLTQIKQ